jgi:hypothetical protein
MLGKLFNRQTHKFEVAICCIVRDEEYLTEWIEYHALIGITKFYIYDNESIIPVNKTLAPLIDSGLVEVISFPGKVMQLPAYHHCLKHYGPLCKWIAFIDADEFIVPKTLTGNFPEFLKAYEAYAGLGINWLVFGSNGHVEKQDGTIQSYTRRSLKSYPRNKHVKSIVQPRFVIKALTPHDFEYKKRQHCVNENFVAFSGPFSEHSSNKVQLNHYFTRSQADYIDKKGRGRADTDEAIHQRTMDNFYLTEKNANLIIDESIIEVQMLIEQIKSGNIEDLDNANQW